MGRIPAPACPCVSIALWCSTKVRALWNVCFILALVCMMRKTRASWGVGLSASSLGQLDMVWWMILVFSSLHAIDRGTFTRARIRDWKAKGLARGLDFLCAISRQDLLSRLTRMLTFLTFPNLTLL